ncbi:MAG: signal peptidase II [Planctomycetes bacterium]|nr:signal peptidase II [Planctomycetota bacterium]
MEPTVKPGLLDRVRLRKPLWIATAATLVIDQLAKSWALLSLRPEGWQAGDPSPHYPFIDGVIHGTWSLGSIATQPEAGAMNSIAPILGMLFWSAIFFVVAFKSGRRHLLTQLGAALLFAGMISNLLDVSIFGGVRNFMELGFDNPLWSPSQATNDGTFAQHPQFSTGAIALWLGMASLIIGALIDHQRNKKQPKPKVPLSRPSIVPRQSP